MTSAARHLTGGNRFTTGSGHSTRTPNHQEETMTTTEQTTTNPDEYNGWTNRETWSAALHLSNDYDLYQTARRLVAEADADCIEWYADHDATPPAIADTNAAADALAGWVDDMYDQYHETARPRIVELMMSDVGSLWRVDWREVADSFRDE
jgi:hypothetical protein